MALVGTQVDDTWWYSGLRKHRLFDVAESSYTSSGSTPLASNFAGFNKIDRIIPQGVSDNGHAWRWDGTKVRAYKANAAGGSVTESWADVKGGESADQTTGGTAAVNGAFIIALVTATDTAKTTIAAEPNTAGGAAGRNVVVQFSSAGGGALPADMGTATVVGTDQFGTAQTEVIDLTDLNSVNPGAGGEVFIVGTKVFATVTSLTLSVDVAATLADAEVSLGLGTIFGLRGKITAESDIKTVRKDDAEIAASTFVGSATTHSVDLAADVADNVDIIVQYDAVASSLLDREAAGSVNIGTTLCEVVGV